ncbi:hypothetical protein QR680_009899 [Steinernema hermaphroditum]|uniref:ATP-dependent RNA helicase n=1 Tax=Steinernema hermaphroditum TaxID=289476 RepID=A0AA39IM07_9BILA|nr:hypothetical protein QR680_009899 [Steinernema hermaphroditum]
MDRAKQQMERYAKDIEANLKRLAEIRLERRQVEKMRRLILREYMKLAAQANARRIEEEIAEMKDELGDPASETKEPEEKKPKMCLNMNRRERRDRQFGRTGEDDEEKMGEALRKRRQQKAVARKNRAQADNNVEKIVQQYTRFETEDPVTFQLFKDFPLSHPTQRGLKENDFTKPTEIQQQTLALALKKNDIIGEAKTGSGKTLAFLIPLLECLWRARWSRNDGLAALVITPTRELAFQIFQVLNKVGKEHEFSACLLIGGTDVEFEKSRIGLMNIIICTPGRLLQHMDENPSFSCDQLQLLVIDEADRILDMGFKTQMNAILENLPPSRQTLLFSATQTKNVEDLARLALRDPVYVSVHENASNSVPDQLTQNYFVVPDEDKINILWSFLANNKRKKTLVFVSSCKQARFLTETLRHLRPGLSLLGLWGTMAQNKRLEVFAKFDQNTRGAACIATDVASRGLDFKNIDWVLQLDCPAEVEDYIHRVGRTARMNRKGEAALVLTPSQEKPMLERLRKAKIILEELSVDKKEVTDISKKMQATIIQFSKLKEYAQRSFVAYIRSVYLMRYKDVFDVESIDYTALARSYGLADAPRVRFLKRAQAQQAKKEKAVKKEKSTKELVAALLKQKPEDIEDTVIKSEDEDTLEDEAAEFAESDSDDDVLKVARTDVFNVLQKPGPDEPEARRQPKEKKVSKKEIIKKALRADPGALQLNKKVFDSDDEQEPEVKKELANVDGEAKSFDIEEAKKELRAKRNADRLEYKTIRKRAKKQEQDKKRQREEEGSDEELDMQESGDESDNDIDTSWLPDPDRLKQEREEGGFIDDDEPDFEEEPEVKEDVFTKASRKRKRESIEDAEAKALKLLGL